MDYVYTLFKYMYTLGYATIYIALYMNVVLEFIINT